MNGWPDEVASSGNNSQLEWEDKKSMLWCHTRPKSKTRKNMTTRWQHSSTESLCLFFKREASGFRECIVTCLRALAPKWQSQDQPIHAWMSRDCLSSLASSARLGGSSTERFSPPQQVEWQDKPGYVPKFVSFCNLCTPSSICFEKLHLHSHLWELLIQINIWKALGNWGRKPVYLSSTWLSCCVPNLPENIMTLLLVKYINFVPVSCAMECIVKWRSMADMSQLTKRCLMKQQRKISPSLSIKALALVVESICTFNCWVVWVRIFLRCFPLCLIEAIYSWGYKPNEWLQLPTF